MKKLLIFAVIIFSLFFVSSSTVACSPCAKPLNLEETIKKADLIVIGQKIADGPRTDYGKGYRSPDWVKVKVIKILKGSVSNAKIKVNSWDGMCGYGITVNDSRNYLMLLQVASSDANHQYDTVNFGCAQKSYLVENNQVNLNGQKTPLEILFQQYELTMK